MRTWPGLRKLLSSLVTDENRPRSIWITVFAFSLAGLLFYISLRGLDWAALWSALKNFNYSYLLFFLPANAFSYLLRAVRWRILLPKESSPKIMTVFWSNMAGYLGNYLLPARAGELVRAGVLARLAGLNTAFILATGLVERLFDLITLINIGTVAVLITGIVSSQLRSALLIMSLIGISALIFMIIIARFSARLEEWINRIPHLNPTFKTRLSAFLHQFALGISSLSGWHNFSRFLALTALIWLVDGLLTAFLANLFHFPLNLAQALVLLSGLGLSSAIPSTPGYIGIYQFVAIIVLVPFGMMRETALAFILVLQFMGLVTIALLGSLSLVNINQQLIRQNFNQPM